MASYTTDQINQFASQLSPEHRSAFLRLPPSKQVEILDSAYGVSNAPLNVTAPPPKPSVANQAGGAAGNVAGVAGGSYIANSVGGAAAAAPAGVPAVPTIVGASHIPAAPAMGATPVGLPAAGAVGAALYGDNLYEGGVNDIVKQKAKKDDYLNTAININPVTAPANIALRLAGQKSIGKTLFPGSKTEVEDDRLQKLIKSGAMSPDTQIRKTSDPHAWYNTKLDKDFQGMSPEGEWTNNKFAMSRNVADLLPEDIMGYAAFAEKYGADWQKFSHDQRRTIAKMALDGGAVKEHHGTIDVDWSKLPALAGNTAPEVTEKDPYAGQTKPVKPGTTQNLQTAPTSADTVFNAITNGARPAQGVGNKAYTAAADPAAVEAQLSAQMASASAKARAEAATNNAKMRKAEAASKSGSLISTLASYDPRGGTASLNNVLSKIVGV